MAEGNQQQTHVALTDQQSSSVADIAAEFERAQGRSNGSSGGRPRGESTNYRGGEPMGSDYAEDRGEEPRSDGKRARDGKGRFTSEADPDEEFDFDPDADDDFDDERGPRTFDPDGELDDPDLDDEPPRRTSRDDADNDADEDEGEEFEESEDIESLLDWAGKEFPGLPWQKVKELGSRDRVQDFMDAYQTGLADARRYGNQYPPAEGQQQNPSNLPNEQPPSANAELADEDIKTPIAEKLLEEGYSESDIEPVKKMERDLARSRQAEEQWKKTATAESEMRFLGEVSDLEHALDRIKPLRKLLGHQEQGMSNRQKQAREAIFQEALAMQTNGLQLRGEFKSMAHYVKAAIAKAFPSHVKKAKTDRRTRKIQKQSRGRMGHGEGGRGERRARNNGDGNGEESKIPEQFADRFRRFAQKTGMKFTNPYE